MPVTFAGASRGPLRIYEGLPHQGWERESFLEESRRPDVIQLAGWPFYRDPIVLDDGMAATLTACASAPNSFIEFGGEKRCGGFHPDFALAWGPALALLCFGCGEALLVDDGPPRRVDVRAGTFQKLLASVRQNRPLKRRR